LILDAMGTDDIPLQSDFPFAFKAGELSALHEGWNIVK
jgi:tellurite methyltransferase